ncbi:MAG: LamG-like jellyroll fold domain-containing protein, partial [Verrucomicrobiota bacterium]
VNGQAIDMLTVEKEGTRTTVTGRFPEWLPPHSVNRIALDYGVGSSDIPFNVPAYAIIPGYYGLKSLEGVDSGFSVNVTQISDGQAQAHSAHGLDPVKADLQVAGELLSPVDFPYYNEAAGQQNGWHAAPYFQEGILNWSDTPGVDAGYFRADSTSQPDERIPLIEEGMSNGLAIEVLAYLQLEAGFHTLGVNTIGGFKATMGPDGNDRLAPVLGVNNEAARYSFLGDHYFSFLAPEEGFYPIRIVFFHHAPTKEGPSMELFSFRGARRIAVNDPDDPDAIKAFRFESGEVSYVSEVSPLPGDLHVDGQEPLLFEITEGALGVQPGSFELVFDGIEVSPEIETEGSTTQIRYAPGALPLGSSHTVEFAYTLEADPPIVRREQYEFGVFSEAASLPVAWAAPSSGAGAPGFALTYSQAPESFGGDLAGAENLLAQGADYPGAVVGEGSVPVLNLGAAGFLEGSLEFSEAGIEAEEHFAMTALAHLHLPVGAYTFGVNSDDGFKVTAGAGAPGTGLTLAEFGGGRGIEADLPQDLYDFVVRREGLYTFRLLYFQNTGDAEVEWYQFERSTGQATPINEVGAVRAYQNRSAEPETRATPVLAAPGAVDLGTISIADPVLRAGLIVVNAGSEQDLTISQASLTGAGADHFEVISTPEPIGPDGSGLIRINFSPLGESGAFNATLVIDSNDADQPATEVLIRAAATDPLGPVVHYRFDETGGDVLLDGSGNQRDGLYFANGGSIDPESAGLATGSAAGFEGGAYAKVEGDQFKRWESFTISLWMQANDVANVQMLFGKGDTEEGEPNFALLLGGGELLWFRGVAPEFGTEGTGIEAGQTYHVAVTYANTEGVSQAIIYLDGVEAARLDDPAFLFTGSNEPMFFGAFQGAVPYNGVLDDLQIYPRVLSEAEVALLQADPGLALGTGDGPVGPGEIVVPVSSAIDRDSVTGEVSFELMTELGRQYALQYSESLERESWETIQMVEGSGQSETFSDAEAVRVANGKGFYRVRIE